MLVSESPELIDLLVIGGGINGVGIAADAAGRGLSVRLIEKGDLASGTSSKSTKLIHGGLRYLEFYEFGLVRKALLEREVLCQAAPHIIKPLAFTIPQLANSRPALLLRAGLFLYDFLAKSKIFPRSRAVNFDVTAGSPFVAGIKHGFEYWDAQVDDSRLVILNAQQAHAKGAKISTYTECIGLLEGEFEWVASLRDTVSGDETQLRARAVVNASGPWVAQLLENFFFEPPPLAARLVKGSHIIVPKLHDGSEAFMLQHYDGRVVFVIPYLEEYSLIGTTEAEVGGSLDDVEISEDEIEYLIEVSNSYFKRKLSRDDVVATYSGVRPLIDEEGKDATRVSRDYRLESREGKYPLISVYGGKVTTYRKLAEDVMHSLEDVFSNLGKAWTKTATLPGGTYANESALASELRALAPWLEESLLTRWMRSYGSTAKVILRGVASLEDLGEHFGHGLYAREIDYLISNEWARSAGDILWRRSKLGYHFKQDEVERMASYVRQRVSSMTPERGVRSD